MDYNFIEMNEKYAREILEWHYEAPYSIYDLDESAIEELLNKSYYALLNGNQLLGFFCHGFSAQVPYGHDYHVYDEDYLDIGLGMHPDHCGKGWGSEFLQLGLNFFQEKFKTNMFRLTVFDFNKRAINLYLKSGFMFESHFPSKNKHQFLVMTQTRK